MRRDGFTFVEILIVMIIIGVIAALGIPRIRDAIEKQNVRSTRAALGILVAKARAVAVDRGCRSTLYVTSGTNGRAWVAACRTGGPGRDTIGGVEQLAERFGVTITAGRDSIAFDPRGLAAQFQTTVIHFQSGGIRDSVVINPLGKVVR
ncbi:MAG: GspH/FimT family pseudopilin [Gemmatimonadetes bacterium]|nr:GspH/FimT family pseudopilin [Gemmatimonadota bacterium]